MSFTQSEEHKSGILYPTDHQNSTDLKVYMAEKYRLNTVLDIFYQNKKRHSFLKYNLQTSCSQK